LELGIRWISESRRPPPVLLFDPGSFRAKWAEKKGIDTLDKSLDCISLKYDFYLMVSDKPLEICFYKVKVYLPKKSNLQKILLKLAK